VLINVILRLNLIIKCWSVIKLTQVLSYYLKK
jgi:hypothetical protein